jgi:hypothetical protein
MAKLANFLEGTAYGVLNDLLGHLNSDDGYATPNRFEVVLPHPPKVASVNGGGIFNIFESFFTSLGRQSDNRGISLRCESVTLPGRTLNTLDDTNIYGPVRQIVDGVTYAEDVTMMFQSSSGLAERAFFEDWQRQAFNDVNWNVKYHKDYVSTIEIYLLDRQDKRRYGIKLFDAFPKTIGAIDLNYASNNEIIKTPVTFSFRYWETLDKDRQSGNLLDDIFETVINSVTRNISRNIPRVLRNL